MELTKLERLRKDINELRQQKLLVMKKIEDYWVLVKYFRTQLEGDRDKIFTLIDKVDEKLKQQITDYKKKEKQAEKICETISSKIKSAELHMKLLQDGKR